MIKNGFLARFFGVLWARPALFVYLLALVAAAVFLSGLAPVRELASGALVLSETDALSGAVTLAQWLTSGEMITNTVAIIFVLPVPIAMLCLLLLAGPVGSFASGMEEAAEYPANGGMGFLRGYQKCAIPFFALAYLTFAAAFVLAFAWVNATAPIAALKGLADRGSLPAAAFELSVSTPV